MSDELNVIGGESCWMEGDAVRQLERVAGLPGMTRVVGMPDMHPGKGCPIGAVFFSESCVFPILVGNDIGCGMSLWQTNIKLRKAKLDRWERKLRSGELEGSWQGNTDEWLSDHNATACGHEHSLGTIGGGNHFAELLRLGDIAEPAVLDELGLRKDRVFLLVHSGSRGYGEQILRQHVDRVAAASLAGDSAEGREYLVQHDAAVLWAQANRALVAQRMADILGFDLSRVLDVVHNHVERTALDGVDGWLHRKGAAPADRGMVIVPGSRGTSSVLVEPIGDGSRNACSLAHGAGRKWKRSEVKGRLRNKYSPADLERTDVGSRVLCDDRDLLYQEAPQAYKAIESIIDAMADAGIARPIAQMIPLLTYKGVRT